MAQKVKNNSVDSLKAGIWYTVCNFLIKGLSFLTTPIFSRLLLKKDFGTVGNFNSWLSILAIVGTLHLYSSVARAKYEFEDDFDGYLSSVVFLGSVYSAVLYGIVLLFPHFFETVFDMDMRYIHVIFWVLIFSPALDMMQIKHRFEYKYKFFVFVSLSSTIISTAIAVLLVLHLDDKLFGRIYGAFVPNIIIYIIFFFVVLFKGKTFYNKEYWKFALTFTMPIIPHLLANVILGSSDKIMITKLVGSEANAIYTIAYSLGMLVATLQTSFNSAMCPWLYEKLHAKDYEIIKKVNKVYILTFAVAVEGMILIAPELVRFIGGKEYASSVYLIAPVMIGYGFKFAYNLYINVEQYEKKTGIASVGTLVSAGFNFITNLIFIPIFGYQAAAYTTLASFILLLLIHYFVSKRLNLVYMYDNVFTFACMFIMMIVGIASQILYLNTMVRYGAIVVLGIVGAGLLWKLYITFKPGADFR